MGVATPRLYINILGGVIVKKLLGLGIITMGILTLSGCGNNKNKEISSLKLENSSLKKELNAISESSASANKKQENKTSTVVGSVQYTITKITNKKIANKKNNYTDAEYNMSDIKSLPKSYYRATINYKLKNVGKKAFDLSYYQANVIDAKNNEFTSESSSEYGFDENSNGKVNPGMSTSGSFYLISDKPIDLSTLKINVSEQSTGSDTLGAAGVVEFK